MKDHFHYSLSHLWLALLLTLATSCNPSTSPDPNFHIYLCFGQSNMEGHGEIEAQDKVVDDRFLVMPAVDCPEYNKTVGTWHKATPPLCQCDSKLSPVDYFGRTMVSKLPDNIKVGVISVAVGGCDIRLFDKDQYQEHDTTYNEEWFLDKVAAYNGNPYNHIIELAQKAQEDGVIKGVLLHQGETNTGEENWPEYVNKIYSDMLNDLSLSAQEVPLLVGELVSEEGNCCASMNPIINTLSQVTETAHIISSKDCSSYDQAHFDTAGQRELGRRYARKMLTLMEN